MVSRILLSSCLLLHAAASLTSRLPSRHHRRDNRLGKTNANKDDGSFGLEEVYRDLMDTSMSMPCDMPDHGNGSHDAVTSTTADPEQGIEEHGFNIAEGPAAATRPITTHVDTGDLRSVSPSFAPNAEIAMPSPSATAAPASRNNATLIPTFEVFGGSVSTNSSIAVNTTTATVNGATESEGGGDSSSISDIGDFPGFVAVEDSEDDGSDDRSTPSAVVIPTDPSTDEAGLNDDPSQTGTAPVAVEEPLIVESLSNESNVGSGSTPFLVTLIGTLLAFVFLHI